MPVVLAAPPTEVAVANPGWEYALEEPTPVSEWKAVAGASIGNKLLEWPPDLFALTEVLLQRSEAFRFALSPPAGSSWPPAGVPDWPDAVVAAARQWSAWTEDRGGAVPPLLAQEWATFRARVGTPLNQLADARDWRMCEALLTLHAIADEACAGLGLAHDASGADGLLYRARGRELLARTGSLSRLPPHRIRVLPRVRTPPSGSSVRALSRYAAVTGPGVAARWHDAPSHRPGPDRDRGGINLLLLPWPLHVLESDFHPVTGPLHELAGDPFGFFEFEPAERLDLDLVERVLAAADDEAETVDVVVLPESAIDHDEIAGLEAVLGRHGVTTLVTGVRGHLEPHGQFPPNWVHIGVSVGGHWVHITQAKHHRWSLDEGQISQYHLSAALHPQIRWWEAAEVPRRSVQFVELLDGVTLAPLVCEDLAQSDEVADVIRSVGPMLVVAPLLDGPQLDSRWSARYAGVLADDPGSAVLTLTSFGMAQRSRPAGFDSSPVVALWKGPGQQAHEIPLESGAHAVLLSATVRSAVKRSFDGRRPLRDGSEFVSVDVRQVRSKSAGARPRGVPRGEPTQSVLDASELTILTSWAEAVADALAFAPMRVAAVSVSAQASSAWRAELRIPEPGTSLRLAIDGLVRIVRTAGGTSDGPSLAGLLQAVGNHQPDELAVDRLVRAALRSALDRRRASTTDNTIDVTSSEDQARDWRNNWHQSQHGSSPRRPNTAARSFHQSGVAG
jgi:hypothetical protein